MTNTEALLPPLSPENPCGEDLSYDPGMQELDTMLRGKPETQFSAAEDPNWEQIKRRCLELFTRSKDLRIALILNLALLKTEGVPGFQQGLSLVRRMLEQYWEALYPRLDPEDNNDPRERVNIISALLTDVFDDPMQFLGRLRAAPLSLSPQLGRFGLADITNSQTGAAGAPGASQIEGSFRDTKPEALQGIGSAVATSIDDAKAIDDFLTRTLGSGQAPNFAPLTGTLIEMRKALAKYVPEAAGAAVAGEGDAGAAAAGPAAAPAPPPGTISSRGDVAKAIDRICDFYAQAEPGSPIPLLLRRAQRLLDKSFIEIITDISPDALKRVQDITGVEAAKK